MVLAHWHSPEKEAQQGLHFLGHLKRFNLPEQLVLNCHHPDYAVFINHCLVSAQPSNRKVCNRQSGLQIRWSWKMNFYLRHRALVTKPSCHRDYFFPQTATLTNTGNDTMPSLLPVCIVLIPNTSDVKPFCWVADSSKTNPHLSWSVAWYLVLYCYIKMVNNM